MAKPAAPAVNEKEKKGILEGLTSSIDAIANELKADLASMTPPAKSATEKHKAELQAKAKQLSQVVFGTTQGLAEEEVIDLSPPDPLPTTQATPPTGAQLSVWEALKSPEFGTRYQTDSFFLAHDAQDVQRYVQALQEEEAQSGATDKRFTLSLLAAELAEPGDDMPQRSAVLKAVRKATREHPRAYGMLGAGPRALWPDVNRLAEQLANLLRDAPKLVAIGPVGLDEAFAPYAYEAQQKQALVQLHLAAQWGLPVWLSHRKGATRLAELLQSLPQRPTIVVSDVLETQDDIALIESADAYVLLRPELTDPAQTFYRQSITNLPHNRLLLASGSALVAPHGFAGHFNQPKFLHNTLTTAANLLNLPLAEMAHKLNQNLTTVLKATANSA